jgi:hypothetical protein
VFTEKLIEPQFSYFGATGNCRNEAPCRPDAGSLEDQRRRKQVARPKVDFHCGKEVIGSRRRMVAADSWHSASRLRGILPRAGRLQLFGPSDTNPHVGYRARSPNPMPFDPRRFDPLR